MVDLQLRRNVGRSIAICGFSETSRDMANQEPPDVEIWGLNRCYTFLKRLTRHFEVHGEAHWSGRNGLRDKGYLDWLRGLTVPIICCDDLPDVPQAKRFPLAQISETYCQYFTSSIAFMLALAVYEDYLAAQRDDAEGRVKDIRLYGVDMSSWGEYAYQKPCVEFWLGVAKGQGITLVIPSISPVLQAPLYAHDDTHNLKAQIEERLQHHLSEQCRLQAEVNGALGSLNELALLKQYAPEPVWKERRKGLQQEHQSKIALLNCTLGQIRECYHFTALLCGAPLLGNNCPPVALLQIAGFENAPQLQGGLPQPPASDGHQAPANLPASMPVSAPIDVEVKTAAAPASVTLTPVP